MIDAIAIPCPAIAIAFIQANDDMFAITIKTAGCAHNTDSGSRVVTDVAVVALRCSKAGGNRSSLNRSCLLMTYGQFVPTSAEYLDYFWGVSWGKL